MVLQRYTPYTRGTQIDYGCGESPDGAYVRYSDVEPLIATLREIATDRQCDEVDLRTHARTALDAAGIPLEDSGMGIEDNST